MDLLLAPDEPPAVEVRNGDGPFLVVCEHAANRIPRSLGSLGLQPTDRNRHIAWDLGAIDVAEGIACRLNGTLVVQRYSRLVVDCNRDPMLPDAITTFSEDTAIPGNIGLDERDRGRRLAEVWTPFHDAVDRLVSDRIVERRPTALVTVHSFTPVYRGVSRPWHVGIISTDERELAEGALDALRRDPALIVGDNEPYSAKDNVDYTIRRHGRDRGLPHVMIEIRNDIVGDKGGRRHWAEKLASILGGVEIDFEPVGGVVA
jgi:predicted N-formylglutamate amidohydrolase